MSQTIRDKSCIRDYLRSEFDYRHFRAKPDPWWRRLWRLL